MVIIIDTRNFLVINLPVTNSQMINSPWLSAVVIFAKIVSHS